MFFKLWEALQKVLEQTPFWRFMQPFSALITLYLLAVVSAYQFIQWRHHLAPEIPLFLRGYLFQQITVGFIGAVALVALWRWQARNSETQKPGRALVRALGGLVVVLAIVLPVLLWLAPTRVSHIRVKFLAEPDFDRYALVYLIYELNRRQKGWYFEVDFDVLNEAELTTEQRRRCATSGDRALCLAQVVAAEEPLIGITPHSLGRDTFFQNGGPVSAISTYRWDRYGPPGVYRYLAYSIVVQSLMIHLNTHCGGPSGPAFEESHSAHGNLFQFVPRRAALKPAMLAAHLNRTDRELLFNCFGAEYLTTASELLDMQWIEDGPVRENLTAAFGVEP